MPRTSRTPYAILGALSHGPKSGYDISRLFERTPMFFWSESYGQIYPTLKRLREEGLVEMERDSRDAGPDRKVYSLTESGREALQGWLKQPTHKSSMRDEAMLKLYFTTPEHHEVSLGALDQLMTELKETLDQLTEEQDALDELDISDSERTARKLTLDWARRYHEAKQAWCKEAAQTLSGRRPTVVKRAKRA